MQFPVFLCFFLHILKEKLGGKYEKICLAG